MQGTDRDAVDEQIERAIAEVKHARAVVISHKAHRRLLRRAVFVCVTLAIVGLIVWILVAGSSRH